MNRPTKNQAEGVVLGAALGALLVFQIVHEGVLGTIVWIITIALIVAALHGLIWLARKVGR